MQSEQKNTTFLPKFSKTTLGIIIRGRKRERERRQVFKGKERQLRIGERGKRETEWSKTKSPRRAGPPAPPHNRLSIHGIENWVPGISFYVGSPVFVHSFPWATIFFFDFEGFPHPLVIVEFSLVLSRHGLDDLEVRDVKGLVAALIVLAYATVRPILFLNGALMFTPSRFTAPTSLANINFTTFRAYIFVDTWLFFWVNFAFVFAT